MCPFLRTNNGYANKHCNSCEKKKSKHIGKGTFVLSIEQKVDEKYISYFSGIDSLILSEAPSTWSFYSTPE